MYRFIIIIISIGISISIGNARIIEIPRNFETIGAGIESARDGDTILVHPGVYAETVNLQGKEIVVGSLILTTGDPAFIDSTVIEPDGQTAGVVFDHEETRRSVLRGFTIRHGAQRYGGGVDCQAETMPTLQDLHLIDNTASFAGGGMHCSVYARPLIERCLFQGNHATSVGGGGLSAVAGSFPVIRNSRFIGNSSEGNYGGGAIWIWLSSMELTDSEVALHDDGGAAITTGYADTIIVRRSNIHHNGLVDVRFGGAFNIGDEADREDPTYVLFDHVLITDNLSAEGAAMLLYACIGELNNLTVANNRGALAAAGRFSSVDLLIKNSIFFNNSSSAQAAIEGDRLDVDYCDIENGRDGFVVPGEDGLIWGENNFDANPLFRDADHGDYRLQDDSPCIDAGDPDSPNDPDWTRADIGAVPSTQIGAVVAGRIYDAATDDPIAGILIPTPYGFALMSDSLGVWIFQIPGRFDSLRVRLDFRARGYTTELIDTMVHAGDSIWCEIAMSRPELRVSIDSLSTAIDSGGVSLIPFQLFNPSASLVRWQASSRNRGEFGSPLGTIRQSIPISEITGDDRIQGIAFDGEQFYCAGANSDEPSLIYVLDRGGRLIRSFQQAGNSRYGYNDLEWDGNLLWGSGTDTVFAQTQAGEVEHQWRGPLNPNANIAYDPVDSILWLSGVTSSIYAVDLQGNRVGPERGLDRFGFRLWGLAWCRNDPDGYMLYVLAAKIDHPTYSLFKINTIMGDTLRVLDLPLTAGANSKRGGYISHDYDKFHGSVFMYIANVPPDSGGDRMEVIQLHQNNEWLSTEPPSGVIPAGDTSNVNLSIRTSDEEELWTFLPDSTYEGEVVIDYVWEGESLVVPVTLQVVRPDAVPLSDNLQSTIFNLQSAFPNPFNSSTTIRFSTSGDAYPTRLAVYGIDGRLVKEFDGKWKVENGNEHTVIWEAGDLPGGIYLIRLEAGTEAKTVKAVLMK
jgi:hypothetical protein